MTDTTLPRATPPRHGAARKRSVREPRVGGLSTNEARSYVQIGNNQTVAPTRPENTSTSAPVVVHPSTALTRVPSLNPEIRTPLIAEEWKIALETAGILSKYPQIPLFITYGADAGISPIWSTFTPPNHQSIMSHRTIFNEIVNIEFQKGRYWGPYSKEELERIIGPFQTSPLSLILKPGKPGKFRLIQNLSYLRNINGIHSINSSIESDLYPCTWGTFSTAAIAIQSLPPDSMGACRDVSEAY